MLVLVTGGAGYIGSHVVKQLSKAGNDVVVYDNLSTGVADMVLGGQLVVGDLADRGAIRDVLSARRFDAVMHFAASTKVAESVTEPFAYYRNNSVNTLNLIEECAAAGIRRLVFSSTAAVYGVDAPNPIPETAPCDPINPYGGSKLISERMLADCAAAAAMDLAIIRYFNVAGADPEARIGQCSDAPTHLIPLVIRAALGLTDGVTIHGTDYETPDGTCIRDYIHVEDIARAHLDAVEFLINDGRSITVNCGYGHGSSVREVIEMVKTVTGASFPVTEGDRRAGDMVEVVAENEKIRQLFGWTPRFDDLETIIRHALAWERNDLNSPPPLSRLKDAIVLGQRVNAARFQQMEDAIVDAARAGHGGYVCVANVHMLTLAKRMPTLAKAMRDAAFVTSDGMPLVWALKRKGHDWAERVAGPDLVEALCKRAAADQLPLYFYGGSDTSLASLKAAITSRFPDAPIAGMEAPPLLPDEPTADPDTTRRINETGARIVFVGLGCPKQEIWMTRNAPHLNAVVLGVGAAFDFVAGTVRRAPQWMQRTGMEWLFRLAMEPKRLCRRYLVTNAVFLSYWIRGQV